MSPDEVLRVRFVSRAVEPVLGIAADALSRDAHCLLDLIHPEDRDRFMRQLQEQVETLRAGELCFRVYHAQSGGLRWIEWIGEPQRRIDGTVSWVGFANDVTDRVEMQSRLRQLAHYDRLTALPNRRLSLELTQQALELAQRENRSLPLLYLDLEGFKAISDRFGQAAGDELLRELARRMMTVLRASDVLGRVGTDEFVILLPNTDAPADAQRVADKLRAAIAEPMRLSVAGVLEVSVSIGIAWFPEQAKDLTELVRQADRGRFQDRRRHDRLAARPSDGDERTHGG
nr:sensor domain-containing diguanylate cyclase [Methylonatrum kenyense]